MHACTFHPRMSTVWLSTISLCIFKLWHFLLSLLGAEHKAVTSPFSDVEKNSNQRWMVPDMMHYSTIVVNNKNNNNTRGYNTAHCNTGTLLQG